MKKIKFITMVIISIALITGCGLSPSSKIDLGSMDGTKYTNNYFGMSIEVPEEWVVQSEEEKMELMKLGIELSAGDNEEFKKMLEKGAFQTVYLLSVFKHDVGTVEQFNPSFSCYAENLSLIKGVKNSKDYIEQMKKGLKEAQIPYEISDTILSEKVGGKNFDVLETTIDFMGFEITQRYYFKDEKGYILCFITTYTNNDEKRELEKILKTVKF
ncbi:UNVERIFIED_CONTAM: hypothetical protein Cloal_0458 [Acetivibrio alkalicellulosi]